MKGLLIKDFQLMKNQKTFLGTVLLVSLLFLAMQDYGYFVIGYVTMMFAMFTITVFSYDEFDNGMPYLLTLPFSRKEYVIGKYVFALLSCSTGWVSIMILTIITKVVKTQMLHLPMEFDLQTACVTSFTVLTVSILFLAVAIPVEIKFGVEKGRIAFLVTFGVFWGGFFIIMKVAEKFRSEKLSEILESLNNLGMGGIVAILAVVWIVALAVSVPLSVRIMSRKEY